MKGTEKQVKWAEDLINKAFSTIDRREAEFEAAAESATSESRRSVYIQNAENYRFTRRWLTEKLKEEKYQVASKIIAMRAVFERYFEDIRVIDDIVGGSNSYL